VLQIERRRRRIGNTFSANTIRPTLKKMQKQVLRRGDLTEFARRRTREQ
jgi:hypothetical protein